VSRGADIDVAGAAQTASVIRLYTAFQFAFSLLLWVPVFYEYQRRIGLDDTQIFGIQSIYYVVFALFEIPTGFMADRLGPRRCLEWGAFVLVLANVLPPLSPTYGGMLTHFLMIALARSLISGASSAYLYDWLAAHGRSEEYKAAEGRARAWSLYGRVVCWAVVGALMEWQLHAPYWITAGVAASAFVVSRRLPALPRAPSLKPGAETPAAKRRHFAVLGQALVGSPVLLLIMLQGVALFVMIRLVQVNLFQPILGGKGYDAYYYGVVMAGMTVFEAFGSALAPRFRLLCDDRTAVFVLSLAMAGSMAAIPWVGAAGTGVALAVFSLVSGLSFPIQRQLLNDTITTIGAPALRATLLSVESIIDRSVCAWVAAGLGAYLAAGQLDAFLTKSAVWTASAMAFLVVASYAGRRTSLARQRRGLGSSSTSQPSP
jgi:MFS family permease